MNYANRKVMKYQTLCFISHYVYLPLHSVIQSSISYSTLLLNIQVYESKLIAEDLCWINISFGKPVLSFTEILANLDHLIMWTDFMQQLKICYILKGSHIQLSLITGYKMVCFSFEYSLKSYWMMTTWNSRLL